jgi:hypothetical protein
MRQGALAVLLLIANAAALAAQPAHLTLTFEDRMRAQEAIERVYYSYQVGATIPFEQAVPREALQKKVIETLKRSVALEALWGTPVTAEMLRSELDRISRDSRLLRGARK